MSNLRAALSMLLFLAAWSSHALELVTEDDPPHNMMRGGKIVGMATEKLEEAFERVGEQPQIQLMPWARAYKTALTQKDYCVFSAARTAEREPMFKWIGPIAAMEWVLYTRADNPVRPAKLADIRHEVIGGYLQDVISVWLAAQGYRVDTAPSDSVNPKKLLVNRIKYWASSRPRATVLLHEAGLSTKIVPILTFGYTELFLACNYSTPDDTVRKLNHALQKMREDGTFAKIEARYARWPKE